MLSVMEMKSHDVMYAGVLSGDLQIELPRSKDPFSLTRSNWLKSFVVKLGSPPGGEMCF